MNYNYEIVYSNRKNLSITVTAENKIILRCPVGMSAQRAEKFLYEKSDWVDRAIRKNNLKAQTNRDILSYEKILVNGQKLPLILGSTQRRITKEGVYVKDLKDIKKLYCATYTDVFLTFLNEIAANCGLKYNQVVVKNYKSRWGCCDGKNNLSFNYKVFMLPEHIRTYITVHELCHTVYHDHSKNFWNLVGRFLPDYKRVKRQLKNYDFLTTLY